MNGEQVSKFLQKLNRLLAHPLFGAATLLAIQARLLWGSWHNWDLPLWDGSVYYINGRTLLTSFHFPSLEWSPLFAIYYAAFQAFIGRLGPFLTYYAHRIATQGLILLLLYWLFRKLLGPLTAWIMGAYFILLWVPVTSPFVVHNFILIPLLAAYLIALHPGRSARGLILAALLLACLVRSEMVLALLAYGSFLAIDAMRAHKISIERRNYLPVAGAFALTLVILIRTPLLSTNRLWAAFGQHYAWGYSERHPEWGKDPWLHWEEITRAQFDGAQSLWQAARANPRAVATHVLWNVRILPGGVEPGVSPLLPLGRGPAVDGFGRPGYCRPKMVQSTQRRIKHHECTGPEPAFLVDFIDRQHAAGHLFAVDHPAKGDVHGHFPAAGIVDGRDGTGSMDASSSEVERDWNFEPGIDLRDPFPFPIHRAH